MSSGRPLKASIFKSALNNIGSFESLIDWAKELAATFLTTPLHKKMLLYTVSY